MTATILIVEGEATVALDLQAALRRLGYDVAGVAASGAEALALAESTRPDGVLMGAVPRGELDGAAAAALLRARWDLPVVVLIARGDDGALRDAIEAALATHRAGREARERATFHATTLRAIGDGVIAADAEQRVTFMNRAAERLTGWSAADAAGRRFAEVFGVIHEPSRAPVEDPVARALRERRPVSLPESSALSRKGGGELPIEDLASPIVDDGGALLGAVVVFRDVSEKRSLLARLLAADRMASVGMLAAGIGHEINNPLSYVVANLDYALLELEDAPPADPPRLAEALREARQGAERIGKIVRQLRTWSRAEQETPRVLDLRAVLDSACAVAATEVRHRARLITEYGAVPPVFADEARLTQLFTILLVNAAQALPEGQAERHEIRVSAQRHPTGAAVVEVRDTAAADGAGLGLPIVHHIVGSLGGRVEVERVAGEGGVSRVILPPALAAGSGELPVAPERAAAPTPLAATPRRVLIVDDEPLICGAVQRALSPEYEVTAFTSAREALETIAGGQRYDAILVDLLMPEMSGMDLYAELARVAPAAARRVVFLTGGAFTRRARDFLAGVGNRRLEKPFDTRSLQAVLDEVLARSR